MNIMEKKFQSQPTDLRHEAVILREILCGSLRPKKFEIDQFDWIENRSQTSAAEKTKNFRRIVRKLCFWMEGFGPQLPEMKKLVFSFRGAEAQTPPFKNTASLLFVGSF